MAPRAIFPIFAMTYIHIVLSTDADLARKWAPRVWLDKEEKFYPSSVNYFLARMKMLDRKGRKVAQPRVLTEHSMPTGKKSYYLTTKTRLKCASCTNVRMLFGKNPSNTNVPAYAIVKDIGKQTKDIKYDFFYPYNRGKTVRGHYIHVISKKKALQFGNHVGDWEHITIRFFKDRPKSMYVAYHSFGITYTWNGTHFRNGAEIVHMHEGHPVIYSARGSHGSWVTPGRHNYLEVFGVKLFDETSAGTAWDTWNNLVVIKFHKNRQNYSGRNTFMRFQGLWGNKEMGCKYKKLIGVCTRDWGPR